MKIIKNLNFRKRNYFLKRQLINIGIAILFMIIFSANSDAQPTFIGLTSAGGDGYGTIFKANIGGNTHQVLSTFKPNNPGSGGQYTQLCVANNGKMYGVCTNSGPCQLNGVLFSYDMASNVYTKLYHFDTINGNWPYGTLVQAGNGKLYGTASGGGAFGSGVIFEFDIANNTYTKKKDFNGTTGRIPIGSLMQAPNGKLYGLCSEGGLFNTGELYEYDYNSNTLTGKKDLSFSTGDTPYGALVAASNGNLYALTLSGGLYAFGSIIEYNIGSNTLTKVHDFDGINGSYPFGSLTLASNGLLYGMTQSGGSSGEGVLFEYDYLNNQFIKKVDFSSINGTFPVGSLFKATNNKLYGLTFQGGPFSNGIMFEYNPLTNNYASLYAFNFMDGATPSSTLTQVANGNLYGIAMGGKSGQGVIFEYNIGNATYTKKIDLGGISGARPDGPLLKAQNGKYYGIADLQGGYGSGVIFEFDYINGNYLSKYDFQGFNGSSPMGPVVETTGGDLYGCTFMGGSNDVGVLYKYNYNSNIYTQLYNFAFDSSRGTHGLPLFKTSGGILFGMTQQGGINGEGILYDYDYTLNVLTKRCDFECNTGCLPSSTLSEAPNGKLYGLTPNGGLNSVGVIFEFDPTNNNYLVKKDFDNLNGAVPQGALFLASNGKYYGTTASGGLNNVGTLFQYDYITNTFQKIHDFSGGDGLSPVGYLMQATDNKLYGMTYKGGLVDRGVIFSYDIATNTLLKVMDFMGSTLGRFPTGNLVEVPTLASGIAAIESQTSVVYPNPNDGNFTLKMDSNSVCEIEIADLMGRIVYQTKTDKGQMSVLLPVSIGNGTYLIRLKNATELHTEKLIIQR